MHALPAANSRLCLLWSLNWHTKVWSAPEPTMHLCLHEEALFSLNHFEALRPLYGHQFFGKLHMQGGKGCLAVVEAVFASLYGISGPGV
ncbi:hypothetical protein AOQ84DRAFT_402792, partial [Glonium stellatum]